MPNRTKHINFALPAFPAIFEVSKRQHRWKNTPKKIASAKVIRSFLARNANHANAAAAINPIIPRNLLSSGFANIRGDIMPAFGIVNRNIRSSRLAIGAAKRHTGSPVVHQTTMQMVRKRRTTPKPICRNDDA